MILDTAFVVDVIDEDDGALEKVTEMERADVVPKVPAMTLLELYIGVGLVARSRSEEQRVKRVIGSLPFVELTDAMAMKAGRIIGELKRQDRTLKKGDAAVGAAGLVLDEPVLTRNVDDFERIPNLRVETY